MPARDRSRHDGAAVYLLRALDPRAAGAAVRREAALAARPATSQVVGQDCAQHTNSARRQPTTDLAAYARQISSTTTSLGSTQLRILVIEDDVATAEYVATGLADHGHQVEVASDGTVGFAMASAASFDVLVVDRMLPGRDGLEIVVGLRAAGKDVPVLFLSTLAGIDDRVGGLNAGGDDYLVKPFDFTELLARVHALGRRPREERATRRRAGALELDLMERTATWQGRALDLLPREFELLDYLVRNAGQLVTKGMLLQHVWGFSFDPRTSVVETHLSRLRSRLDREGAIDMITTVRGGGYIFRPPA